MLVGCAELTTCPTAVLFWESLNLSHQRIQGDMTCGKTMDMTCGETTGMAPFAWPMT